MYNQMYTYFDKRFVKITVVFVRATMSNIAS